MRELQRALIGLGLVIGPIDGIFGPVTERGVRAVQQVNGLPQTGVVDTRVAELLSLDGTADASASSSSSTTTTSTESEPSTSESSNSASASSSGAWGGLAPGASGDGVRELQQELRALGLVVNDRAGDYGEWTTRGVRAVQSVNSLAETGVVDAEVADILGLDGTPDATDASTSDTSSDSPESDGSATAAAAAIAVAAAKTQVGVPYSFARAAPGVAFDCSGLTKWAWARAGVYLPHYSAMQYAMTTRVSVRNAQPGDLLFYHSPISHVAMYLGDGLMIHAPEPGALVTIRQVRWSSVVGIGRPG